MTPGPGPAAAITLSVLTAVLLLVSAAVGLFAWRSIYKSETATLVDSAAAQDLVSLVVGVLLLVLTVTALRDNSDVATLVRCGTLAFVAYNAAIYCFSIHFGPLFLAWTALLGLSIFGTVLTAMSVDPDGLRNLASAAAVKIVAWVLIGSAVIFALLWLKGIVADLAAGRLSSSAQAWNVPTNPVHVLDLAIFLPAVMLGGVLTLQHNPTGLFIGLPGLTWMILTCLPILLTPSMAKARGHTPDWSAVPPVGVLLLIFLGAAAVLIRTRHSGA